MNNQFFQQSEQFFKPMTDLMALNAKTFEALTEKQTGLMSDVWNDGVNYARHLSDKQDVESFYTSQKEFWEGMSQKFSNTAKDSYALLSEAQERMTELMQDSMGKAGDAVNDGMNAGATGDAFSRATQATQEAASESSKAAAQAANQAAFTAAEKSGQKNPSSSGKAKPSGSRS